MAERKARSLVEKCLRINSSQVCKREERVFDALFAGCETALFQCDQILLAHKNRDIVLIVDEGNVPTSAVDIFRCARALAAPAPLSVLM